MGNNPIPPSSFPSTKQRHSIGVQTARPRDRNHRQSYPAQLPPHIRYKERDVLSPNSSPARSDQRPNGQTRQKREPYLSFLTAGPCREDWSSSMSPLRKLTFLDKRTPEHQEHNNLLYLLPLLPQPDEEERRHHLLSIMQNFESKEFSIRSTIFFLKVPPYL